MSLLALMIALIKGHLRSRRKHLPWHRSSAALKVGRILRWLFRVCAFCDGGTAIYDMVRHSYVSMGATIFFACWMLWLARRQGRFNQECEQAELDLIIAKGEKEVGIEK